MKKYFTYIIIAAAMAFAASCAEEQVGVDNSDATVTLRLQTSEMETRATVTETGNVIAGVGAENTLTHADFFFFSDAEGTTLISHERLEVGTDASGLVSAGTNIYEHKFDVSDEGNPLQNASYVYVIANYPSEITKTTLADILDLDINIDLSGTLTAFVMDSYADGSLTYLSPSKTADSKTFTIGLKRAAAKLELNFNVKDEFEDAAGNVWTPVFGPMWVNFLNARKVGKVAAKPVAFDEKTNYFSTAQYAPTKVTPAAKEGYTSWTIPAVYTYPQQYQTSDVTAPYYKIFIPWVCEKKGQNNFYYKIILPELGSFKRNKIYKLTVDVSVIGGTEDDWALVTDHIYVADWWAPEKIESSVEGAMYLDVPVKYYEIYGIDDIEIPVASSNEIEVVNVTGTKQNLYGTNGNGVPTNVSVTPTISYNADGKSSFTLTHQLNTTVSSTNFDSTPITYTMTVKHTAGGLSKTVNVTVVQYPSIYAMRIRSNGYVYVNGQGGGSSQINVYNNNHDGIGTVAQRSSVNGTGTNNNQNNYNIYVSVLPADSDDIIGDPRDANSSVSNLGFATFGSWQGNDWTGYTARNSTVDNTVSDKYLPAGSNSANIIAPAFKIASSYGKTTPMNATRAKERCASYQEDGFPAGRWRLPTSAEVLFVRNLSRYQHIPSLFQTHINNGYWTADGYIYSQTEYGDITTNTSNTRSVRCVYDVWYWGEAPLTNAGANATPVKDANGLIYDYNNEATQWLGFKMD